MIERQLQTVFCDDIRHEIGGKLSFIGVYSTSLLVASFPVSLPKLCISARLITSVQEPFESLVIRIEKDDELLQELVINDEQLAQVVRNRPDSADDDQENRIHVFQALVAMTPIVFDGPCVLRVRAKTEGEEIRGPGLKVEQIKSDAQSQ